MDHFLDAEDFNRTQHSFMTKKIQGGYTEDLPQHTRGHVEQAHNHYHTHQWKALSSSISKKERVPTRVTFIQQSIRSSSQSTYAIKINKHTQIGKEQGKLHLQMT